MINDIFLLKLNCYKQHKYGIENKTGILLILSYLCCVVTHFFHFLSLFKLLGTLMFWPLHRLTQFSCGVKIIVFDTYAIVNTIAN